MRRLLLYLAVAALAALWSANLFAAEGGGHGGDILYTKPVKSVIFSHKAHVEERGLGCDMCHPKLFELRALAAQERDDFTMDSLYKGKFCGACHDGKTAFASNTQCARCHSGVKGQETAKKKQMEPAGAPQGPRKMIVLGSGDSAARFNHQVHTKNFGCNDCHGKTFAMKKGGTKITMNEMYQGKNCGECHNGKRAFAATECAKCHEKSPMPKGDLVYKMKDLGPVKFSHDFHTKMSGCNDCHPTFFSMKKTQGRMTMSAMEKGKFCGGCHNGNGATPVSDCGKCHK